MANFNEIYARVKAGKYTFADSTPAGQKREASGSSFDKIYADVKAGKYTFAGGATPLHEDHLGAYRAKKAATEMQVADPLESVRNQMAQIEASFTRNDYTAGAGSTGMEKFVASKQAEMKKEEEKTFWQRFLEANAKTYSAANDNPVVMSFNQLAQQYRDDTSYREPNEDWTDRQKDIFGYLYERIPVDAYSFAQQINDAINTGKRQNAQKQAAANATESVGSGVGHAVLGRVTNLTGTADILDKAAEFAGRGTVTQKDVLTPYEYGKTADSAIAEQLNEGGAISAAVPVLGGKGWGDVYSLATSVADSMIGRYAGGKWGTAVNTFSGIMSSTMNRDMEKGADKGQAALHGLVSGLAEAGVEFLDVDRLIKLKSADGLKGFLRNVVKTAVPEGIEETITAVIDTAADQLILGDKSDFNALVGEYKNAGYNDEDAKKQAWIDTFEDILYAGFAGAAAGGVSGGIETGIKTGSQNRYDAKTGKLYAGVEQELIEEGLAGGEGTESYALAKKLQEQMAAGKAISDRQLGQLVRANEVQIRQEQAQERQKEETAESQTVGSVQQDEQEGDDFESQLLTDADLDEYMRVGERLHVRNTKQRIVDEGGSPILTKREDIAAFIRNALSGKISKTVKAYGRVNDRLANAVKEASSGQVNIDGYYMELDSDKVAHISDHVGSDEDVRNIPLSEEQIERLPEYIHSYDDLINIISRKDGSVRLMLGKKINGHTIIVETVSKGRMSLHPVTAYQIDSADYEKYYKTRAIDRSSTSRPKDSGTVDISRQAIAPADNSIRESEPVVNNEQSDAAENNQQEQRVSLAEKIRRAGNESYGRIINEQAAENGEGTRVFDGSRQRDAGVGTAEQTGSVEGRTGKTAQRAVSKNAAAAGIDRQTRAQRLRRGGLIQPVSSKSLGLSNGTDVQNLLVLPESEYDSELRTVAARIKAETGKDITFVVGGIQTRNAREMQMARGVRTSDSIIVQVDNMRATATQIADHEAYHDKARAKGGWGLNWSIRRDIEANYSAEEFQQVVEAYVDAMAGTVEITDAEEQEAFYRRMEEEVLADAYAGIDYRGLGAAKFTGAVNDSMDSQGLGKGQKQNNGVRQTNGPNENTADDSGEWYSLSESFESELQEWFDSTTHEERKVSGKRFLVGTTTDVLKSIGVRDYNIYFGGAKVDKILTDNESMSLDTIKAAVKLLEDPILIMDSVTVEDSIVLFGEVYTNQQKPVMISVLLNPKTRSGEVLDYAVITSAYGRRQGNLQNLINRSEIYYVNEQKNRTDKWLKALGLQLPSAITKYGSINSISDFGQSVNGKLADQRGDDDRYSYDDSDFDQLDAQLESESQRWRTTWLKDQLGEEGYKKYQENRAQRDAEQRKEQRLKDREQRKVETNRRKLQREYREKTIDAAMNEKLKEGAQPTEAKRELKRTILDTFSIPTGSRAEAAQIIESYADRIIKNGTLTEADRKRFFDRMYAAGVMTVAADEYTVMGREILYRGKIYVNESVRRELGDDWAELRRRAFGAGVYLTTNKADAGIDMWQHELSETLPGLFDSEGTDLRQTLERIVQVAEEGRNEQVSLAEYTAQLAGQEMVTEDEVLDHMERQLDTALQVFAKTAGIEIKVKEQAIRDQAALRKENMRQRLQRAQERQDRKEQAKLQTEQKELKELQQKTLKSLQWLSKNRHRAPEELRAAFDEVLSDLDIYAVGAANAMRWSDKYNATWKDVAEMYRQAKEEDPNFMPSKELDMIVSRLNDRKIEDLDIDALNDLYKAAVGLRTEYHNRNNVMNDELNRLFADVYADAKEEITAAEGGFTGNKVDKLFNMDQLTAMNVLQRMGGWDPNGTFYSMAKQLERGERDVRAFTVKANRALEEFLTEHEDWVKKSDGQGKDATWYTVEVPELLQLGMGDKPIFGETVTVHMTPAQKVHMYLESKNVDNLRHMAGGRTFADRELYSKGKRKEAFAQGKTIRLAPETVKQLVSDLTAEERELAGILEQYYNNFAKGEINRVSNILYGYDKAIGSFYAPIFTNQNYVQSEVGIFDQTAEGVSNLKARQVAKNPSYQIGAFDAFERNVEQTARFVGMAIPARNWNSLLSWQERGNSMGDVITHKWGAESKSYIENLLIDLQGGKVDAKETVSELAEKLLSNYISSVFGFNPGIVLKQLGSIPMAGSYLGIGNVPNIKQVHDIDRGLIAKYTQDLDWRSMGYSMPETKQLKENPNWTQTNKVARFAVGGGAITAMDAWAASTLWPWAENKVRKEHPELDLGTQAQIDAGQSSFYKKVADEFENAVARSQSVADVMHQSTIRKSKSVVARTFTLFRSDSAQTYNALRQKIGEAQYLKKNGADKKQIQKANRAVGTVFLAAMGNFMLAELVNLLMNLWKKKGKNYRDEEGEITFESVAEEVGTGILQSTAGIVIGGEELAELIGTALTGERWYGVESTQMGVLADAFQLLWDDLAFMRKITTEGADMVKNSGDLGAYLSRHGSDILGVLKDTAKDLSGYLGGVPTGNIEAYMIGLLKDTIPGFEAAYDDTFSTANKSSLAGMEGQSLELRVGSILRNRKASEDPETAGALAQLYAEGYKGAVPSDTPISVSIDGEQQKLSAYQKQAFEKAWSAIVGTELDEVVASEDFREVEPEKQEKMLKTLFDYATAQAKHELFPELEPSSRADDIAAFEEAGLGMSEFLRCYAEYTAINAEDLKAKEKATKFSRWVHEQGYSKNQVGVITDSLAYFNMTPAGAEKFESAIDSGLNIDDAYDLQEQMADLEPEEGKVQVTDAQRWRLCVNMSSNPAVQLAALATYMQPKQYKKAEVASNFGINLKDYVRLYEIRAEYDANGNKSYSQAEYKAAIDSLKLSDEYSGILWQLATGSKTAKNNPYSKEAGEMVLRVLE